MQLSTSYTDVYKLHWRQSTAEEYFNNTPKPGNILSDQTNYHNLVAFSRYWYIWHCSVLRSQNLLKYQVFQYATFPHRQNFTLYNLKLKNQTFQCHTQRSKNTRLRVAVIKQLLLVTHEYSKKQKVLLVHNLTTWNGRSTKLCYDRRVTYVLFSYNKFHTIKEWRQASIILASLIKLYLKVTLDINFGIWYFERHHT